VKHDCHSSCNGVLKFDGKFLVKGTFVLGCHFLCTTSPRNRSTVTFRKWTFLFLLAHTYSYVIARLKFRVFRDVKLWQVVLGVLKGHSFIIIISVKESKFLDFLSFEPKGKVITILRSTTNHSPNNAVSFPSKLESW